MNVVDMHCDTISVILEKRRKGLTSGLRENDGHLDLLRMKQSGYLLQNFALYVDANSGVNPWEEVCALHKVYEQEMATNCDLIRPILCYEDIEANEAAGYLSAMLTVEEGAVCLGEIEKLRKLYDMGVRMLTLTWNYPNELGYPNMDSAKGKKVWQANRELRERMKTEQSVQEVRILNRELQSDDEIQNVDDICKGNAKKSQEKKSEFEITRREVQSRFDEYFYTPNTTHGLTERGREFVTEMEHLGMIVDVSHLSDKGFYDVLECSTKPFVASHSNERSICRCVRNLTDDMIRRLAERGGCTGLNYCADFLEDYVVGTQNPGTIEAIVRHAKHITNVGGIEVLGLGSDFDGIDTHRELPGAQSMELLWDALHKAGYTPNELDRIFRQNVLKVYREVLN